VNNNSGALCSKQLSLRCPMCVNDTCGKMKHFFRTNQVV
jgi:hypothetical protein